MSEVPAHEHPPRGEWIKFAVLTAVLLGTIGVIALLRPYIFGVVVPAVLGEGIEQPVVDEGEGELEIIQDPDPEEVPVLQEGGDEDEANPVENEEEPEAEATAVPEGTRIHTVAVGDTISRISRLYDVPVSDIVEANDLTNPDVLTPGDELVIPEN